MDNGTRLGQYEILEPIGAGGMGEVYRARDVRLERDVAIKVLPEDFAADVERLARFEREAKLLAQLNHANIATIHGLEDVDGIRFIAMECVEGETLADRLIESGRLELDEALEIARQMTEALEAAHARGVVHRDLKPANVKVTPAGKVKVLDFGLAKAYEADGSSSEVSPDLSGSPTMLAATGTGVIMGTAAYMSPEQARGSALDKRTDIWSFGCVLFELLTGNRPFGGPTVSDALASILKEEPDWELLPGPVPGQVRRLLRRCLQKDPGERLHDIADARIEIREAIENPATEERKSSAGDAAAWWRAALPWGLAVAMAAWAVFALYRSPAVPAAVVAATRFQIPATFGADINLAYSQDGSQLVYEAVDADGVRRLYRREMNSFEAEPIAGTEGGAVPSLSPDGEWVAFRRDRVLAKVPVAGGPAFPIAGTTGLQSGADWGDADRIVFQRGFGTGLVTVSADGGDVRPLTRVDPALGERQHAFPAFLPGGEAVLFTIFGGISSERSEIAAVALDGGRRRVLTEGAHPRYVATGHLVFIRRGALMAAAFDPLALELLGDPVVVVPSVRANTSIANSAYDVSRSGALAYVPAVGPARVDQLVWVDRQGNTEGISEERRRFTMPRLSPDGRQLAVSVLEDTGFAVWTYDFDRDAFTRVTRDGSNGYAQWTPDGRQLAFSSDRAGPIEVFRQSVAVEREIERLAAHADTTLAGAWSPDGRDLLVTIISPDTLGDIGVIRSGDGDELELLLKTAADEYAPEFSPDGKWFAYSVAERGGNSVYVQSYPDLQTKKLVGTAGSGDGEPSWSRDGGELFYLDETRMMAVSIELGPDITIGRPRVLFDMSGLAPGSSHRGALEGIRGYDVSADGTRFLMVRPAGSAVAPSGPETIHVVLNWSDELESLAVIER